jgi:tetratricopeptide (TPR) repeat protein
VKGILMFQKIRKYIKGDNKSQSISDSNQELLYEMLTSSVNTWPVYEALQKLDLITQLHGVINIESGNVGIYTKFFGECDTEIHTTEYLKELCKCGRNENNFISLRCGDGDGLYTVFTLVNSKNEMYLANEELPGISVADLGYLIRCNAGITEDCVEEALNDLSVHHPIFPDPKLIEDKSKSSFYLFGSIMNLNKIFISDAQASINGPDAILTSNYPTLGEYYVFAVCLNQPRDQHGMFPNMPSEKLSETIIVPRDIIVLHKDYAQKLLPLVENLPRQLSQIHKDWLYSIVTAHMQPIPELTYRPNSDIYLSVYGRSDLAAPWLAQAHLFQGEEFFEEPWSEIVDLIAKNPQELSRIYSTRGLFKKAEEVSLDFINSESKMTEEIAITINSLAFSVYFPQKQYDKAKLLLARVINEFTGFQVGIAYGNLGLIEFELNLVREAKNSFSKSFDLVQGTWAEGEALYYLALINLKIGERDEAVNLFEKCYERPQLDSYRQLSKLKLDEIFSDKNN